ncbi:MAG: sulfatase [Planctomycetes bacterium]|nr:sulfatase [Planctomycetota bacterium]
MKSKGFTLCSALLFSACNGSESPDSESSVATGGPNVLLISIDSLRADHCTPYDYRPEFAPNEITTPFLQRIAEEGMVFEHASASSSWTLPSHLSLFSAEPPRAHGVRLGRQMLDRSQGKVRLAGQFKQAGYATYGIWSAPFLHPAYGYQGNGAEFDRYVAAEEYLREGKNSDIITDPKQGQMMAVHGLADSTYGNSPRVNEIALAWLDEHASDSEQPFFLFLHYWDVHYNYVTEDELAKRFLPDFGEEDRVLGENFTPAHGKEEGYDYTSEQLARIKALYDAEIRSVDDAIAEVYAKLEELGLAEDTVIAVISDHGDHFGEEHEGEIHLFHHRSLFEEVVHIPFIVKGPGVPIGVRVDGTVALYDVGPTVLDLAGLPAWKGVAGRSARPLWEGKNEDGHEVLMDLLHPGVPTETQAWRHGKFKGIWELGFRPTRNAPNGIPARFRAYNLAQDPHETLPIAELAGNELVLRSQAAMQQAAQQTFRAPQMEELPDNVRSGLEGTGYVDSLDDDK